MRATGVRTSSGISPRCPLTEVAAVCDTSPARLEAIGRTYGHLHLVDSLDRLLELPLDAVAIATPVSTHYSLASRCLEAGLHVLVEKPLTATVWEAEALIDLAERHDRVLMVDHTYLFNNAVRRIKELVESGELGDLYYIDSIRINLGLFQHDINVVWDLAPHDLSIVDYVLGCEARSISAWGCAHADRDVEDIAYVNVDFGERMLANFHVNWLSPVKVRQMIFAGSRKSLIFNELNTTEPIKVYDRGIDLGEGAEDRRRIMVSYRSGDVWSPHIEAGRGAAGRGHPLRRVHPRAEDAAQRRAPGPARRPTPGGGDPEHPGPGGPRRPFPWSLCQWRRRRTSEWIRPTSSEISPDVRLGRNVIMHCFVNLYGCRVGDETGSGASSRSRRTPRSAPAARSPATPSSARGSRSRTRSSSGTGSSSSTTPTRGRRPTAGP